jgi:hypothetical protein
MHTKTEEPAHFPVRTFSERETGAMLIITLRKVVTLTFEEVFDYRAYAKLLFDVRRLIAAALVPCNPLLEEIEVEPVAAPQRDFQEDDDEDSDQEAVP